MVMGLNFKREDLLCVVVVLKGGSAMCGGGFKGRICYGASISSVTVCRILSVSNR